MAVAEAVAEAAESGANGPKEDLAGFDPVLVEVEMEGLIHFTPARAALAVEAASAGLPDSVGRNTAELYP